MKLRTIIATALLASAALAAPAMADAGSGAKLFKMKCSACHSLVPGQNKIGPSLAGVFGRKAGLAQNYKYSAKYVGSTVKWDAATLDKYLANPTSMFAGTRMVYRLPAANERTDVIDYLKTNPKP
jgi:cytochrome c